MVRLCVASLFAVCLCPSQSLAQGTLVLSGVTVIDGTGAAPRPNRAVIVSGDRISAIVDADRRADVPKSALIINARGKFLIPGLWDMHVHLTQEDLSVLVAYGVTGVRDMGNSLRDVDTWRVQIADGARIGPRIYRVGPILNGQVFGPAHVEIDNADQARAAVRVLKHVGVDFIKTHAMMPREAYFALVDEARKSGVRVVGHVPKTVSPQEASDAGQASLEHMQTLFEGSFPPTREDSPTLFALFARNQTAFVPTLVSYRASADPAKIGPEMMQKYPDIATGRARMFKTFVELLGLMNKAGVTLMTGTDLDHRLVGPGSSLHDELEIFVEAGLTPMQALQAATRNPARFVGIDAGTIEPGKLADMVLLDTNPLDDIRNTRRIHAVVVNGRILDQSRLRRR